MSEVLHIAVLLLGWGSLGFSLAHRFAAPLRYRELCFRDYRRHLKKCVACQYLTAESLQLFSEKTMCDPGIALRDRWLDSYWIMKKEDMV